MRIRGFFLFIYSLSLSARNGFFFFYNPSDSFSFISWYCVKLWLATAATFTCVEREPSVHVIGIVINSPASHLSMGPLLKKKKRIVFLIKRCTWVYGEKRKKRRNKSRGGVNTPICSDAARLCDERTKMWWICRTSVGVRVLKWFNDCTADIWQPAVTVSHTTGGTTFISVSWKLS